MKVKAPSQTTRVEFEPHEVKNLIEAARQVEKAYAKESAEARRYYAENGHWPPSMGIISGDTLLLLNDLAKALMS